MISSDAAPEDVPGRGLIPSSVRKISQDFEMIFYFFRPTKYLRAERTARAGKIEKRSKAGEIFHLPDNATAESDTEETAERAVRASG